MSGKTATVAAYPPCDFCKREDGRTVDAHYDAKTWAGPWAFMCRSHFFEYGFGLGTGIGQQLVLEEG